MESGGHPLVAVQGLLMVVAFPGAGHGLLGVRLQWSWHVGSADAAPRLTVVVHGLSCPVASGIFPDQGRPLH